MKRIIPYCDIDINSLKYDNSYKRLEDELPSLFLPALIWRGAKYMRLL
jgi:hypothetical protein